MCVCVGGGKVSLHLMGEDQQLRLEKQLYLFRAWTAPPTHTYTPSSPPEWAPHTPLLTLPPSWPGASLVVHSTHKLQCSQVRHHWFNPLFTSQKMHVLVVLLNIHLTKNRKTLFPVSSCHSNNNSFYLNLFYAEGTVREISLQTQPNKTVSSALPKWGSNTYSSSNVWEEGGGRQLLPDRVYRWKQWTETAGYEELNWFQRSELILIPEKFRLHACRDSSFAAHWFTDFWSYVNKQAALFNPVTDKCLKMRNMVQIYQQMILQFSPKVPDKLAKKRLKSFLKVA